MQLNSEKASIESYLIGIYLLITAVFGSQTESFYFILPYLTLGVLIVYSISLKKKIKQNTIPIGLKLYFLFGLWAGISHIWIGPYDIKYGGYLFLVQTIFFTVWNSRYSITKINLINILIIYSISILPVFAFNLVDIQKSMLLETSKGGGRFYGTFGNANAVGLYGISIIWSVCFVLIQGKISKIKKIIIICFLPLSFQLILISGSRKAYLAVIIIIIFIYIFLVKYYGKNLIFKFLSVLIFSTSLYYLYNVITNSVFYFRFEKLISGDTESISDRGKLMSEAFDVWTDNPLIGVGFDSFRYHNNQGMPSHSSLTETLASTGIVGFSLYFSGLLSILFLFYKLYKKAKLIKLDEIKKDSLFFLLFTCIFLFFNTSAILYNSRDMWPILGLIYIYSLHRIQNLILLQKNSI